MNPFLILGVPADADDQTIRRAYLGGVKESPPDVAPKRFQELNEAYEKIKDQESRNRHLLFNVDCPAENPLGVLTAYARHAPFTPPGFEAMKKLLASNANPAGKS